MKTFRNSIRYAACLAFFVFALISLMVVTVIDLFLGVIADRRFYMLDKWEAFTDYVFDKLTDGME